MTLSAEDRQKLRERCATVVGFRGVSLAEEYQLLGDAEVVAGMRALLE